MCAYTSLTAFLGKSALLANWARRFRAQQQGGSGALLVHYVSASAEASSQLALCRRIVAALKSETGFEEEVPADTREVARCVGTCGDLCGGSCGYCVLLLCAFCVGSCVVCLCCKCCVLSQSHSHAESLARGSVAPPPPPALTAAAASSSSSTASISLPMRTAHVSSDGYQIRSRTRRIRALFLRSG